MGQHLVGLVEVAQFLGIVSREKRPGNRLWELLKSFKRSEERRVGKECRL